MGVKFLTLWTEHGLGAHITPYIHSMLCAIPRQSLLVDLIDLLISAAKLLKATTLT
jgi:hypothetical protein